MGNEAVAALRPSLAVQAGMIAAILAEAFYMGLVLVGPAGTFAQKVTVRMGIKGK